MPSFDDLTLCGYFNRLAQIPLISPPTGRPPEGRPAFLPDEWMDWDDQFLVTFIPLPNLYETPTRTTSAVRRPLVVPVENGTPFTARVFCTPALLPKS